MLIYSFFDNTLYSCFILQCYSAFDTTFFDNTLFSMHYYYSVYENKSKSGTYCIISSENVHYWTVYLTGLHSISISSENDGSGSRGKVDIWCTPLVSPLIGCLLGGVGGDGFGGSRLTGTTWYWGLGGWKLKVGDGWGWSWGEDCGGSWTGVFTSSTILLCWIWSSPLWTFSTYQIAKIMIFFIGVH